MQNCPHCGTENDDAALYCKHCGVSLKTESVPNSFDHRVKEFAKDMDQFGRRVGDHVSKTVQRVQERTQDTGKRVEQRVDRASAHAGQWYDRTFGILGPLISSFIFLIIMRLAIQVLQLQEDNVTVFRILVSSLYLYLLVLFGVTLLSNYTQYFSRKYYQFKVFSPLLIAVVPVVWLWVAVQILRTLSDPLKMPDLKTAASGIEQSLSVVFIFVLLIGYVIVGVTLSQEQRRKP
jgi:hypothetical protein